MFMVDKIIEWISAVCALALGCRCRHPECFGCRSTDRCQRLSCRNQRVSHTTITITITTSRLASFLSVNPLSAASALDFYRRI